MSGFRIREIKIACFRGATRPAVISLDSSKPLVVVFGENGTGKSTIVDALDLVANGRVGSLAERSSANNSHAPSIGKKQGDIGIEVTCNAGSWKGTLRSGKAQVSPLAARPIIDILRRSQLLRLVEAIPSERYKALQRFIEVSGVETSEGQLDRVVKASNREIETASSRRLSAEDQLSSLWEQNGKPDGDWKSWAESKNQISVPQLGERIERLEALLTGSNAYVVSKGEFDSAVAEEEDAARRLRDSEMARATTISEWANETSSLIETLSAADSLLKSGWERPDCPVCQQPITPDSLSERVSQSLENVRALKRIYDNEAIARRSTESAKQVVASKTTTLLRCVRRLSEVARNCDVEPVVRLHLDFEELDRLAEADSPTAADLSAIVMTCGRLISVRPELESLYNDSQRDKHQLHTIQSNLATRLRSIREGQEALEIHNRLDAAHERVRALRIQFVQNILDEVSVEADRMYRSIHPGETAGSVRFVLDEAKRGSLNQYGEFAGQPNVEPQGYYSDSHLDTLGFCLWLALAKRSCPERKVVVLDDVFTTVDMVHLGRIIELIDSESEHFAQTFILTHNRNWFDRYRFNQAVSGKAEKIELRRWTPSVGLRTDWKSDEIDEVAALAKKFKEDGGSDARQVLASRCGILLEALLGFISKQYRTSVPNTPDGLYTLGDLLNSCTKLVGVLEIRRHADPISQANEAQCVVSNVQKELVAIKNLAVPIRNGVGCHFNQVAALLPDVDVETFADSTLAFARAIVCSEKTCGQIPQRDETSFHRCMCKRTRFVVTRRL